jgi:transcriptional regulator with XRE-family HTH domain
METDSAFGDLLRALMVQAEVGLRELARLIEKSPGYISDVENGRVPPPSLPVILDIAAALRVNKDILLRAASKVDPELSEYVAQRPQAADFLRLAKDQGFDNGDWERLTQLAKIAKLGKGEREEP